MCSGSKPCFAEVDNGLTGGVGLYEPYASVELGEDDTAPSNGLEHVVNTEKVEVALCEILCVVFVEESCSADILNVKITV